MDFIERIFGFSPDGGSGVFELLLLVVPVVAAIVGGRVRRGDSKTVKNLPGDFTAPGDSPVRIAGESRLHA